MKEKETQNLFYFKEGFDYIFQAVVIDGGECVKVSKVQCLNTSFASSPFMHYVDPTEEEINRYGAKALELFRKGI